MTLLDLIAASLAVAWIESVWLHGQIFSSRRANLQARGGLLGELTGCALCLSLYVALAVFAVGFLPEPLVPVARWLLPDSFASYLLPDLLALLCKGVAVYMPAIAGGGYLGYLMLRAAARLAG